MNELLLRRVLAARDALDAHSEAALDLATLSRTARLSREGFIRAFRRAFGQTPHQYLMTRRLERAASLLRNGTLPVTEVCLEVGFESLGSFSALFRRAFGMSPSRYRASNPPDDPRIPSCILRSWTRPPSTFREAPRPGTLQSAAQGRST